MAEGKLAGVGLQLVLNDGRMIAKCFSESQVIEKGVNVC
jgi:hypothetical protein